MPEDTRQGDFSDQIAAEMPYLRRYARALTGSQRDGDALAVETLKRIVHDRAAVERSATVREGLFRGFHAVWHETGQRNVNAEAGLNRRAQDHLSRLAANSREVLLLTTIEGFSHAEAARILGMAEADVALLVQTAHRDMAASSSGAVLIIEDVALIADELSDIVEGLGHRVSGVAATHTEAVSEVRKARPDLILADIQLADDSSGIEAINEILTEHDMPVVFVTGYPERLLTGKRPEPAFLITKPYTIEQVRSAVSQAMFFASTETLLNPTV